MVLQNLKFSRNTLKFYYTKTSYFGF